MKVLNRGFQLNSHLNLKTTVNCSCEKSFMARLSLKDTDYNHAESAVLLWPRLLVDASAAARERKGLEMPER